MKAVLLHGFFVRTSGSIRRVLRCYHLARKLGSGSGLLGLHCAAHAVVQALCSLAAFFEMLFRFLLLLLLTKF
jgi:hypothetical protein